MTKEDILKIIYPCTSASYFDVNKTSYLYKNAEEIAEKFEDLIKLNKNVKTSRVYKKLKLSCNKNKKRLKKL